MRKFTRAKEPRFLAEKWEQWGIQWEERQAAGAQFAWRQVEGQPVNHRLLPLLKAQTQDHCSFCDIYPVSPPSLETIEHFRPKSKFPRDAYRWSNLYFCCAYCQQKGDQFDEAALQPDAPDYEFDRYFRWDWTNGRLLVNERASAEDQHRARVTIELYRLNRRHPALRKHALRIWTRCGETDLDKHPYRDFLSPATPDAPATG